MSFRAVAIVFLVFTLTFLRICVAQDITVLPGKGIGQGSAVIADLDGDSSNGLETVVAGADSIVHAVKADGTVLWSQSLPNAKCSFAPSDDKLYSSPVVANLFGDGTPYIVIGYGGFRGKPCDGGVAALRGATGSIAWIFSVQKWARRKGYDAFRNTVFDTPAVSDIDGDGKMEIGFGSFDRNVYLLNANGSVRWYYNAADTVFATPAFVDIDNDGKVEMVVATDISQNTRIDPPTPNGGYLYLMKAWAPGRNGTRYLFRDVRLQIWRAQFDQVLQANPALGDVILSNDGPEIVIGSGCFFPQGRGDRRGKWFKVINAKTGATMRTLQVTACTPTGVAIGDVDGDSVQDVVATVSGDSSAGGDGQSHVIAWNPETDKVLWDVQPFLGGRTDRYAGHFKRTPVIADVNDDGIAEVLINYSNGVVVLDGRTGAHITCDSSACDGPLLRTDNSVFGSPAVGDIDQDGAVDIIVGGRSGRSGAIYRWEGEF